MADPGLRGRAFGLALTRLLDRALSDAFRAAEPRGRVVLVALGSYGRRELCPGSDVDVALVHDGVRGVAAVADALWYPLWDAGFVLGHSVRTVREAVALADAELDALTALLDARPVVGDVTLHRDLEGRIRQLAERRRRRVVEELVAGAAEREARYGPVAEMLEPNLKEGRGGLRDTQALAWAGFALGGPGGLPSLVARGYLRPHDPGRIGAAADLLLDLRVTLHRLSGGRSDLLSLQDQDAVAAAVGERDADAMVRRLSSAAREVAWISDDVWDRLRSTERGPVGRLVRGDRPLGSGVVLREGRVALVADVAIDAGAVLAVAAAAAEHDRPIDRVTLERLRSTGDPTWAPSRTATFLRLLRAGRPAIAVFEALDHVGALVHLLPEWAHVRSLPQRNAYHRFTVDRHLLEAVAECATLLDGGVRPEGPGELDDEVAASLDRPDLLLLAALLHDVGKGLPGDHSEAGARTAAAIGRRLGLGGEDVDTLGWLVRHHLVLAETATRRDLSDEATVARIASLAGDPERLRLLYLLTVGDSRATGPAAWGPTKAALVRELFVKAFGLLERGGLATTRARREEVRAALGPDADRFLDTMPPAYALAFEPAAMVLHRELFEAAHPAVRWARRPDGLLECTVVAPDRTGLLATVAGALALVGLDIREAVAYSRGDGQALEVFAGTDPFGRLSGSSARSEAATTILRALGGELPLDELLAERIRRYRRRSRAGRPRGGVEVIFDLDASDLATVVEVHADDEIGLLARLAHAFADLDLDVTLAKVETLADRVVDVFYLRDASGAKVVDRLALDRLRATLVARLTTEYALP
ncbi:MAG: [protein-PII] uridylyltransferase [Acidimicrobiia bacterium]|nr:[protein-PII] uridylyltransferase [Acidimicrobiia bacterium]